MVLADTSVWVDHFRSGDEELKKMLIGRSILMHPYVVGELALGSLSQCMKTLSYLELLPAAKVARMEEVRQMIEARALQGKGIGLVDAHLLAAVFITPSTRLWTRDRRLRAVAEDLKIHANLQ